MQRFLNHIEVSEDDLIIKKILDGDIALFEILIRRYNSVIYKIARSYGFNHQDAEDLMQDTYVAAYTQLVKFEGRSTYITWISRIMINKCLYKLKHGYFKNEVPGEQAREANIQPMHIKARDNQTEDVLVNRELAVVLEKSVQNIPEIYRMVFVLREIQGFSIAETAELLDITAINVKVRLNRAKALLRKEIEQFYTRIDLYSFNLIYCDKMVDRVFAGIQQMNGQSRPNSLNLPL
jgi:RNA polymerase sigma factor (sigma-70 family)